jgi:hypothetical protein
MQIDQVHKVNNSSQKSQKINSEILVNQKLVRLHITKNQIKQINSTLNLKNPKLQNQQMKPTKSYEQQLS